MIPRYALGCAFNTDDLFYNFSYKNLKLNCKQCFDIIGDNHRSILAKQIFKYSLKLVIEDIIERNVTFWFPLTGDRKCNMHMKRVIGNDFKKLRQAGKWNDVDIINSNFSGYEIGFYMLGKRTPRVKTVYVNNQLKQTISKYTNLGKQYGDGKIDTKISDYYQQIYQQFPNVLQEDIKRILVFSWKSLYLHNSYGGDVIISDSPLWCYIGKLKHNALDHFNYYVKKLIVKTRVTYKRSKIPWDGYYYFAISEEQYKLYLQQVNKKGRPRKKFNFNNVFLYQIFNECSLQEHSKKYIFRIKYLTQIKYKFFVKNLKAEVELIKIREPLKFKDILVSNKN